MKNLLADVAAFHRACDVPILPAPAIPPRDRALLERRDAPLPCRLEMQMDIIACHANGCPLRLDDLLAADDFNLLHDVLGISRHIDRSTGRLTAIFRPRFAEPAPQRQANTHGPE